MGRFIGKILVTAVAALIASWILKGVSIDTSLTAVLLALVLALLNGFVKPILVVLTIPITVLTFGLFLLIINIAIIKWAAVILAPHFQVTNSWAALWFSILLSIVTYAIEKIIGKPEDKKTGTEE